MAVYFHEQIKGFKLKNKHRVKKWISEAINEEHYILGDINFVFDNDERIIVINRNYLKHDWYTDVITFNYNDGKKVSGDIFISVERVRENAVRYITTTESELHRVMIHGVLHLCGYDDKKKEGKEEMTKRENYYINKIL